MMKILFGLNKGNNMSAFKRIRVWNEERRLLGRGFSPYSEALNILEELVEASTKQKSDEARDTAKEMYKILTRLYFSEEESVDAYADIIVYATGSLLKLGYDPDKVMDEVLKEIESRTGHYSETEGKFIKDNNVATYKANFKECKL